MARLSDDSTIPHRTTRSCAAILNCDARAMSLVIYHQLRRAFVSVNNSWASSVRLGRFSSTCRLEETESLADPRPLMFVARILIAPCSDAMKPLPAACLYAFSSTRWVAYSEVLRSVMENPNA